MTLQVFAPGFSLPQGCTERGGSLTLPSALEAFALPTRSRWRSPLTLLWCALDTVSSHISFVQLFMSFNYSRDGWVSSPAHQMNSVCPCAQSLCEHVGNSLQIGWQSVQPFAYEPGIDRHLHFHFLYLDFSVLIQKMELTQQWKQTLDTTLWI